MFRALDVATSWSSSILRFGLGLNVDHLADQPAQLIEIYEFEACPFCRKVREVLTMLDLDAMIYPCPKKGPRFREQVKERGGRAQFPYLVDGNTNTEMYESANIVEYLYQTYAKRPASWPVKSNLTILPSSFASSIRLGRGTFYRSARTPEKPLELYNVEASPYCRIVRETLCELELPYIVRNVAEGSRARAEFGERAGKTMVPWLRDPNQNVEMFESADIRAYLNDTYAL